ncbi:hypothetical protein BH09ACT1_BH09ACT1_12020 [soil metagenome]
MTNANLLESRRHIQINVVTTYLARFSNILGLFLLFPIVARSVGPTSYGLYLLIASVATLVQMDLGMASATIRFIAANYVAGSMDKVRRVIASSTWFFLGLAIICGLVFAAIFTLFWNSFAIPEALRDDAIALIALGAIQIFFGLSTSIHRQILAGVGSLNTANMVQFAQLLLRIALTIGVLAAGFGLIGVGVADTIAVVGGSAAAWLIRRRRFPDTNSRLTNGSFAVFKEMFRLNLDLLFLSVAALIVLQSSNLVISLTLPIAAVAVFGAGYRCYQVCREITNSLTQALLPVASAHHSQGRMDKSQDLYLSGTKWANGLLLLIVVPVFVFAQQFLNAWVGSALAAGFIVAQVLLISLIANNNHLIAIPILTGQGKVSGYAILHTIWAASSIGLGFLLSPLLGVIGMAIAVAGPITIMEPIYVGIALKRLHLKWRDFLVAVALPSLLPGLVLGGALFGLSHLVGVANDDFVTSLCWSAGWAVIYSVVFIFLATSRHERAQYLRREPRSQKANT